MPKHCNQHAEVTIAPVQCCAMQFVAQVSAAYLCGASLHAARFSTAKKASLHLKLLCTDRLMTSHLQCLSLCRLDWCCRVDLQPWSMLQAAAEGPLLLNVSSRLQSWSRKLRRLLKTNRLQPQVTHMPSSNCPQPRHNWTGKDKLLDRVLMSSCNANHRTMTCVA